MKQPSMPMAYPLVSPIDLGPTPEGCVLDLPTTEGTGVKCRDRSPYANHADISGGVKWVKTAQGLSVPEFDGINGRMDCGNPASLQVTGDLTILAWMNLVDTSEAVIISKSYSREYEFWGCRSADELAFFHGDGAYEVSNSSGADISSHVGEWVLAGVTRTADPKKVKFYLNDSYLSTWDYAKTVVSGANNVLIGQRGGNNYVIEGCLCLPKVYNRALDDAEIAAIYRATRGLFGV
jgi:hypothetical protein